MQRKLYGWHRDINMTWFRHNSAGTMATCPVSWAVWSFLVKLIFLCWINEQQWTQLCCNHYDMLLFSLSLQPLHGSNQSSHKFRAGPFSHIWGTCSNNIPRVAQSIKKWVLVHAWLCLKYLPPSLIPRRNGYARQFFWYDNDVRQRWF